MGQHPDICMAFPKEPGYFAKDHNKESDELYGQGTYLKARTPEEYARHFSHYDGERLTGEATTTYLYSREAAREIHDYNPDARIIIMLRHPVDFLHSLHMQYVNDSSETERDFRKALDKEVERRDGNELPKGAKAIVPSLLLYRDRVKYAQQIERYQKLFPAEHILFLVSEDFKADNPKVFKQVLHFLGVNEGFEPEFNEVNSSAAPRSYTLHKMLNSRWAKQRLYETLGPQRYTKLKNTAIKLTMKQQPRGDTDKAFDYELLLQTASEVIKASKLTRLDLARKWHYDAIAPAFRVPKD